MKKPRRHLKVLSNKSKTGSEEFRDCHGPGCRNIVSIADKPKEYSGPVYCVLCIHLAEKA